MREGVATDLVGAVEALEVAPRERDALVGVAARIRVDAVLARELLLLVDRRFDEAHRHVEPTREAVLLEQRRDDVGVRAQPVVEGEQQARLVVRPAAGVQLGELRGPHRHEVSREEAQLFLEGARHVRRHVVVVERARPGPEQLLLHQRARRVEAGRFEAGGDPLLPAAGRDEGAQPLAEALAEDLVDGPPVVGHELAELRVVARVRGAGPRQDAPPALRQVIPFVQPRVRTDPFYAVRRRTEAGFTRIPARDPRGTAARLPARDGSTRGPAAPEPSPQRRRLDVLEPGVLRRGLPDHAGRGASPRRGRLGHLAARRRHRDLCAAPEPEPRHGHALPGGLPHGRRRPHRARHGVHQRAPLPARGRRAAPRGSRCSRAGPSSRRSCRPSTWSWPGRRW